MSLEEIGQLFGDEVAHVDQTTAAAMSEKRDVELHVETAGTKE